MRSNFYVYGLVDPTNNQCFYVGKGCNNRILQHEKDVINGNSLPNPHLEHKIQKLLKEGHQIQYVKFIEQITEQEAFEREDVEIQRLGLNNLCNLWSGGTGGRVPSDEIREKISTNRKGIPVSDETREKMRQAKLGTTLSEAAKRKKSKALKGKEQTPAQKAANKSRSDKMKNRKMTEEHKQKLREAKLKNPTKYWEGKNHTQETRNKISSSLKQQRLTNE